MFWNRSNRQDGEGAGQELSFPSCKFQIPVPGSPELQTLVSESPQTSSPHSHSLPNSKNNVRVPGPLCPLHLLHPVLPLHSPGKTRLGGCPPACFLEHTVTLKSRYFRLFPSPQPGDGFLGTEMESHTLSHPPKSTTFSENSTHMSEALGSIPGTANINN